MSIPQSGGGPIESFDQLAGFLESGCKPKDRWQLFFQNENEAVGISLSMEELLRVIDMLEAAFVAGEWPVPGGSYRHVGRISAEEQGQTLN